MSRQSIQFGCHFFITSFFHLPLTLLWKTLMKNVGMKQETRVVRSVSVSVLYALLIPFSLSSCHSNFGDPWKRDENEKQRFVFHENRKQDSLVKKRISRIVLLFAWLLFTVSFHQMSHKERRTSVDKRNPLVDLLFVSVPHHLIPSFLTSIVILEENCSWFRWNWYLLFLWD